MTIQSPHKERQETSKRSLQIAAAPFGWRAIVQANHAICIYRRRPGEPLGHFLPRNMADVDVDQFTTDELGELDHIVAWALVEEWTDLVPDDNLEYHIRKPDDDSYDVGQWVHPVMLAGGDFEQLLPVRILAPGEKVTNEQVRAELLEAWRLDIEWANR